MIPYHKTQLIFPAKNWLFPSLTFVCIISPSYQYLFGDSKVLVWLKAEQYLQYFLCLCAFAHAISCLVF